MLMIFILSFGASANSCEERVLKKYNSDFHAFLENEFKENSNLELFKTIGFLGKATPSGFRMVLNLSLGNLASSQSLKALESTAKSFVQSKARFGTDFSIERDHLFFYPKKEDLPCLDESLYLDSSNAICSVDKINFNDGRIGELKSFLDNIFDKIPQLELKEVDPNSYSLDKNIEVLINDDLVKNKEVKLSVSGGVCDMGKALKKAFTCTIVGGESMTVSLRVGSLSDELTLKINKEMTYKLKEVDDSKNSFQVLKSALNRSVEVLSADSFEINSEKCTAKDSVIECDTDGVTSYVLKVTPEGKSEKVLFADILPESGFELKVKSERNAQYKVVSAHIYKLGIETSEGLGKVSFSDNEHCTYISTQRKILRCKKTLNPYSVSAVFTGPETYNKSVEIGSFKEFSLEINPTEVNSLSQVDRIVILGDGKEIPSSSYKDLGLSIQIKNKAKHKVEYSDSNSILNSERESKEYKLSLELHHKSKISDAKEVKVKKYVGGDNYFFDIIKKNRQCYFNLMKFKGVSEFQSIGQEEFVKNLMDIKVKTRRGNCSSVQKTKGNIQVFCTLKGDKRQEEVTVQLLSNGVNVRTVKCMLINDDYYEEEEEDDKPVKISKSFGSSIFSSETTNSLTQAIPSLINSRYQTQQPMYYNPLMYNNYGYSPYSSYSPGYYQNSGMWNTMYMFNPATY